jgi:predicted SAM-dependent methyltransferase
MVPRALKATYYLLASPLMRMNAARYRFVSRKQIQPIRVHLGPGQRNYLDGWVNVDANLISSRPDIWADLRYKLPFADEQIDAFYSHHVIEHLPDLDYHFREMYRCLKPGGTIRVGGPHGDNAIAAMAAGRHDWFGDWPRNRRSLGGRFENFIFCRGEHLTILTESFLRELAEDAGFKDFTVCSPKQTRFPDVYGDDVFEREPNPTPELPSTLLIEARK